MGVFFLTLGATCCEVLLCFLQNAPLDFLSRLIASYVISVNAISLFSTKGAFYFWRDHRQKNIRRGAIIICLLFNAVIIAS